MLSARLPPACERCAKAAWPYPACAAVGFPRATRLRGASWGKAKHLLGWSGQRGGREGHRGRGREPTSAASEGSGGRLSQSSGLCALERFSGVSGLEASPSPSCSGAEPTAHGAAGGFGSRRLPSGHTSPLQLRAVLGGSLDWENGAGGIHSLSHPPPRRGSPGVFLPRSCSQRFIFLP